MFLKYQHIERFGTDAVDGIEIGECYVFPKIDGTNGCAWMEDGEIHFASRRRELDGDADNHAFRETVSADPRIAAYLSEHPEHRLFGEWLVPHSLKTYRDDAWRHFYIFDVAIVRESVTGEPGLQYLPYDEYQPWLERAGLDYIPPLAIIENPTYSRLVTWLERNTFLLPDDAGFGEGVVIKRYDFTNRFGRQIWAKIVASEFKEKHAREMGAPRQNERAMIEQEIVDTWCTRAMIEKTFAKIKAEGGWDSKKIPQLLGRVYHDLVAEDAWDFVKKNKFPTINFRTLNHFVVAKVKAELPEAFGMAPAIKEAQ